MIAVDQWPTIAGFYVRHGFSVLPMGETKKPLIPWKHLQSRFPTLDEVRRWPKGNMAIVTGEISGIVVVDCESREDAAWFWMNRGRSPMVVKTRRGFHLYFAHPGRRVLNAQRVDNRYDVRGDGGYVLAPPSTHREGRYEWQTKIYPRRRLPVFRLDWRPPTVYRGGSFSVDRDIRDALAYIRRIDAYCGKNAHNTVFRVANILRESGMSEGEALYALQEWARTNLWSREGTHFADPSRQLLHKIRSVYGGQ